MVAEAPSLELQAKRTLSRKGTVETIMLVSRSRQKASPLAMSRVIAKSLLRDLDSGNSTYIEQGAENIVRLLEMYRFDTFSGRQRTGIVRRDQRSKGHFANDQDDLRRLKEALTATHVSIANGTSPSDFAENETGVFKTLARERLQRPETVAKAKNFLSVLIRSLSTK